MTNAFFGSIHVGNLDLFQAWLFDYFRQVDQSDFLSEVSFYFRKRDYFVAEISGFACLVKI
jgi:hypothetical protein